MAETASKLNKKTKENYIYRGINQKLILPDFIFDMYNLFKSTGKNSSSDFGLFIINNLAGRVTNDGFNYEIDSNTYNYYSGLYELIENEGGLSNCDKMSDYSNGRINADIINNLLSNGKIYQQKVQIGSNGSITVTEDSTNCNLSSQTDEITSFNIIRDSNGYLILPNNIYDAYQCFDGDDPFKFASYIINRTRDNIIQAQNGIVKYYAAIFKLLEKEGFCIIVSDYCKNNGIKNDEEFLNYMLNSGNVKVSEVNINDKNLVEERVLNNITSIEHSIYNTKQPQIDKSKIDNIKQDIIKIESDLDKILSEIDYQSEDKFNSYIEKLKHIENRIYAVYKPSQEKSASKSIYTKEFADFISNKYKSIINKIIDVKSKLKKVEKQNQKTEDVKVVDYYEKISSELNIIENELNNTVDNMKISSEKDYMDVHSKLLNLQQRLSDIYDNSLMSAHKDNSLTYSIIKEATSKHNKLMEKIDKASESLEQLKVKLSFNNIFNG